MRAAIGRRVNAGASSHDIVRSPDFVNSSAKRGMYLRLRPLAPGHDRTSQSSSRLASSRNYAAATTTRREASGRPARWQPQFTDWRR